MGARRAGIYVRISSDPTGKALGVARQEKSCREKADALGWTVHKVYRDNDVSASTGKARPAYVRMLADLEAGIIDAVVVWDLDRLTRRPIEVEQFIDLADKHSIALASVGGDVDLSTDNGRMFARIKGAVARAEVERKSARQKAANDQKAEEGRPFMGRRAFGYQSGGMELDKAEAKVFREAVDVVLAGGTIRAVVRLMAERGAVTSAGNPWKPTEVRRLLSNPRHAGLRVHRGEVVGEGTWPAIIDVDTHRAIVAILSDPSRQRVGRPRTYLLSGIAKCGACEGKSRIYGRAERRGPYYVCESKAHLGRKIEPIDDFVSAIIVERLARPDAAELFAVPDTTERVRDLQKEERSLVARLDGLAEAFAAGDIDRRQLAAGTARLRGRLDAIAVEMPTLLGQSDVSPLIAADDVGVAWAALPTETCRTIIDTLAEVTIHPAGRGARTLKPETISIRWRTQ